MLLSICAPVMVISPYNISAARRSAFAQTRSGSIGLVSSRIRSNVFLCNSSLKRVPEAADGGGLDEEKSLANRLRWGNLAEDGSWYKEKFVIRGYEVGDNRSATIETIANLLQEVASNHVQGIGFSTGGFSTTTTMRKMHLIWVATRMHIEVYRYPTWNDVIEIETWFQDNGKIHTRCDWIIKDCANNEIIGRATSNMVMMDEDTRRLKTVSDDIKQEYLVFAPAALRLAFPEENNNSLKKIAKLEDPAEYSRLGLMPRRSNMDMNKHINNVTYIGWALESIPQEIIDTHELQAITLDFKRECGHDDKVDSLTSREPLNDRLTEGDRQFTSEKDEKYLTCFLHLLRSSGNGLEINRSRTEWRKKP